MSFRLAENSLPAFLHCSGILMEARLKMAKAFHISPAMMEEGIYNRWDSTFLCQLWGGVDFDTKKNMQDRKRAIPSISTNEVKREKSEVPADESRNSAWKEAIDLLYNAIVVDGDKEEADTWARMHLETRCMRQSCRPTYADDIQALFSEDDENSLASS